MNLNLKIPSLNFSSRSQVVHSIRIMSPQSAGKLQTPVWFTRFIFVFLVFMLSNSTLQLETSPFEKVYEDLESKARFLIQKEYGTLLNKLRDEHGDLVGQVEGALVKERLNALLKENDVKHVEAEKTALQLHSNKLEKNNKCIVFYCALRNKMIDIEREIFQEYHWLAELKNKSQLWQVLIFLTREFRVRVTLRRLQEAGVKANYFFHVLQTLHETQCINVHEKLILPVLTPEDLNTILNELDVTDSYKRNIIKSFVIPVDDAESDEAIKDEAVDESYLDQLEQFTRKDVKLQLSHLPKLVNDEELGKNHIKNFVSPVVVSDEDIDIKLTKDTNTATIRFPNVRKLVEGFYGKNGEKSNLIGNTRPNFKIIF